MKDFEGSADSGSGFGGDFWGEDGFWGDDGFEDVPSAEDKRKKRYQKRQQEREFSKNNRSGKRFAMRMKNRPN